MLSVQICRNLNYLYMILHVTLLEMSGDYATRIPHDQNFLQKCSFCEISEGTELFSNGKENNIHWTPGR